MQSDKITLKDLALAANVSCSTASRALRNHPRLSADTISRVQNLAVRLGYRHDARLTELMSHLRTHRKSRYQPTIALVLWQTLPFGEIRESSLFQGLWQRAEHCGYKPEYFNLADFQDNPRRLSLIFRTRDIRTVLFCPAEKPAPLPNLDLSNLSVLAIGYSMVSSGLHRCAINHYEGISKTWKILRQRGYRKIGLIINPLLDERTHRYHHAAYLVAQSDVPPPERIPILMQANPGIEPQFVRWLKKNRPDTIICTGDAQLCEKWINQLGMRVPDHIGLVDMKTPAAEAYSGVRQDFHELGKAAVDFLISLAQANETGMSESPRSIYVEGRWIEGTSLRRSGK